LELQQDKSNNQAMRLTFKFFALLDLISILFMASQVWMLLTHLGQIKTDPFSLSKAGLTLLIYISLFFSTLGQYRFKRYGMIVYYIQFPFRLFLMVLSIGFITLLPEVIDLGENFFTWLFRICIVAEFFRLYYTILAFKKFVRVRRLPRLRQL
jgi:hypothetical protein